MNLADAAELTHAEWQQRATDLKQTAETRLFIGGEFVDAADGGTFDNICPDGSRSGGPKKCPDTFYRLADFRKPRSSITPCYRQRS